MTKNYMHVPEGSSSRDPHRPVIPEVITPARAAPPQIPSTHVPAPTSVATPPADDSGTQIILMLELNLANG